MAEIYGRNYKGIYIDTPISMAPPGQSIGRISCLTDFIEWDVNGNPSEILITKPAADDLIHLGHIPKGAIFLRATIASKTADASFAFKLGSLDDEELISGATALAASKITPVVSEFMPESAFTPLEERLALVAKVTGAGANDTGNVRVTVEYLAE